jgi:hypothetical protein
VVRPKLFGWLVLAGAVFLGHERAGFAQGVAAVPAELQAELLAKLMTHDRSFAARAGDTARVLILVQRGDAKSRLSGTQMKGALGRIDRIGGVKHEERLVDYDGALAVAKLCRADHCSVIYVTPGLDGAVDDLRASLVGVDVLSISAVPDYVPRGIVLGFDLVSGKPKILVNLEQARLQNVRFKSDVLALMKVYR